MPKYIDVLQEKKSISIFMELCDSDLGQLMAERRAHSQTFTEVEILDILVAMSGVLKEMHALEYAHMDIKPGNPPLIQTISSSSTVSPARKRRQSCLKVTRPVQGPHPPLQPSPRTLPRSPEHFSLQISVSPGS